MFWSLQILLGRGVLISVTVNVSLLASRQIF